MAVSTLRASVSVSVSVSGLSHLEVRGGGHGGREAVDALIATEPIATPSPLRTEVRRQCVHELCPLRSLAMFTQGLGHFGE